MVSNFNCNTIGNKKKKIERRIDNSGQVNSPAETVIHITVGSETGKTTAGSPMGAAILHDECRVNLSLAREVTADSCRLNHRSCSSRAPAGDDEDQ
ncbi:hypothetical protein PoB_002598700 [Plakobranchus ocellatus]|uniref:Uncharacterized protein n=1 Tax=Plakobranchus ocellatus TaxID=259542 RepID=A0AAV3ZWL8_9GAST|nr:hypothetical protein PoB_002598700 [Plakobranchus ocellatus]